jgi:hypothetical protein
MFAWMELPQEYGPPPLNCLLMIISGCWLHCFLAAKTSFGKRRRFEQQQRHWGGGFVILGSCDAIFWRQVALFLGGRSVIWLASVVLPWQHHGKN